VPSCPPSPHSHFVYIVRCADGKYAHIKTTINDLAVCEFDGATATTDKYEKDKVVEQLGTSGSIAVQVHGGKNWPTGAKCRWKNIRIRPLS
jgi:hypothetical protein